MRIDQLLVQRGLARSRSHAQRLVAAGVRWRAPEGWRRAGKSGEDVPHQAEIELLDAAESRFVSRGGLKLEAALARTGVRVAGLRCLDLGQSTGGFTDCLLQHGAARVVGVDVGSGQLNAALRDDPRVACIEHVNARTLSATELGAEAMPFDLVVGDLSFISQTLVLEAVKPWLKPRATLLLLVKPQFELQPGQLGKGGIVTDERHFSTVEQRIRGAHAAAGLRVQSYFPSPIAGGDGNREFFVQSTSDEESRS